MSWGGGGGGVGGCQTFLLRLEQRKKPQFKKANPTLIRFKSGHVFYFKCLKVLNHCHVIGNLS